MARPKISKIKTANPVGEQLAQLVLNQSLSADQQAQRRELTMAHILNNSSHIDQPNFAKISSEDLGNMFHIIDEHYFEGLVSRLCERESSVPIRFRLSTRMTSTGGMTTMRGKPGVGLRTFEIALATTPLFETFRIETSATVGGLICQNRLEAMQRIVEHEVVHLIELLLWHDSSCSRNPFKDVVYRFFGHVESNHRMLTPRDIAKKKLGIGPGDKVVFNFEGKSYSGIINRISKRATVLVPSPNGVRYTDGHRYVKFYVPLRCLQRV